MLHARCYEQSSTYPFPSSNLWLTDNRYHSVNLPPETDQIRHRHPDHTIARDVKREATVTTATTTTRIQFVPLLTSECRVVSLMRASFSHRPLSSPPPIFRASETVGLPPFFTDTISCLLNTIADAQNPIGRIEELFPVDLQSEAVERLILNIPLHFVENARGSFERELYTQQASDHKGYFCSYHGLGTRR